MKQPDPEDVALGQRIRLRRKLLNISQRDLGDRCGVSPRQVQKYESGANRVSFSRLKMIAEVLACPVGALISDDGLGPAVVADPGANQIMPVDALKLIDVYASLTPDHRDLVLTLAAALAGRAAPGGA